MRIFNSILGAITALLMAPFKSSPVLGLVLISAVVSVGILLVFKKVSNQDKLDDTKRRIHASLFEIRLCNDDLRAIMRAQFDILRHNLSYLRLQLIPLVFILPPMILLLAQLQPYFGYQGLEAEQSVLFKVEMRGAGDEAFSLDAKPDVNLALPEGLRLETPSLWIPSRGELVWRLVAEQSGDFEIGVEHSGQSYPKSVRVSDKTVRRSPMRVSTAGDQFLYPVEQPLDKSAAIQRISVGYPEDPEFLLMPRWMWIFFVLTIVFAFILRKPMGVTI